MRILALDIGLHRTGVAFAECPPGIPLILPTLHHKSARGFLDQVGELVRVRSIDHMVVGLPLLSSGKEGMQARYVRTLLPSLTLLGACVSILDERYSTSHHSSQDPDAVAACSLLTVFIDRLNATHS